jgi:5-methylcytosine-specific restriction endonuclease McrA
MKKCKNCKQEMSIVYNSLQKYCVDKPECVEVWVATEKAKQWAKRKQKLKQDAMTLSDYLKLAQTVFNRYIRKRDEGQSCISCGKKINGVTHASHYKSQGGHSNVRFHELNVWSSCYKCNVELSGNLLCYRERLIEKIGLCELLELEKLSIIEKKWTIPEVKEIIKKYKALTK